MHIHQQLWDGDLGTPGAANDQCSSSSGVDADNDGFTSEATGGTDCDDTDPNINPGATDVPDNGIDENCDGFDESTVSNDVDGDGFDSVASGGTDCDDTDPAINPDALDIGMDGSVKTFVMVLTKQVSVMTLVATLEMVHVTMAVQVPLSLCVTSEQTVQTVVARYDADGDGFYDDEGTVPLDTNLILDCDDTEATTYPGALKITNDRIDQDCDGVDATVVCLDTCQYANDGDCDDGGTNSDYDVCDLGTDCVETMALDWMSMKMALTQSVTVTTMIPTLASSAVWILKSPLTSVHRLTSVHWSTALIRSMEVDTFTILDEDAFGFYFEDVSDFLPPDDDEFYCTITAPPGVDIIVDVYHPSGSYEGSMDQQSFGGDESFVWNNATYRYNDDGIYKVVVTSLAGEGIQPHTPSTVHETNS